MSIVTIKDIIAEVATKRGNIKRVAAGSVSKTTIADVVAEYQEVWDTFNRYVTACVNDRKTVNITNFCKVCFYICQFH